MSPIGRPASGSAPAAGLPDRGNRALVRRLAIVAVLALSATAFLWLSVASVIRAEREQEIQSVYRENANLARAFEEHVRRTLKYADQFARQAKKLQEQSARDADWARLFEHIGARDEVVPLVSVADGRGDIVRSNLPFTAVNIADREHFRAHMAQDTGELRIGTPVIGRISRQWTIQLTRRINKPDGTFGGVVTVGLAARYFSTFYRQLDLGARGSVALVGRDGVVRARQTGDDDTPGQDVAGSTLLRLVGERSAGSFYSPNRIDSISRYISFRALPDYPLVVLVGRSEDEALLEVAARARNYFIGAAAATLLLLAFCAALARGFVNDHRAMRRHAGLHAEREIAFEQLQESEERFRSLTELSSDYYWEQDDQFRFTKRIGMPWEKQGLAPQSVLGKARWELPAANMTEADWEKHRADLAAHREFRDLEIERPLPGGEIRWISTSGRPIFDATGRFAGYRGIGQDITVRKLAELALQRLNAELELRVAERTAQLEFINRELEGFSYSVSHDLRAPLRAVAGFARILEEHLEGKLDDEGRALLERIQAGGQRMGALIDSLLEFARSARTEMKLGEVDLHELVVASVNELQAVHPAAVVSIGVLPRARGDATLLREVVVNLVDNAFKYSSKMALPKIDLGHLPHVEQSAGGAYFVRDNGAGFDPQHAENLFGPFRRLHSESEFPGIGVGLALCKRIIERHGGRIWAESSPDKGATFFFTLLSDPHHAAGGADRP